MTSLNIKPVSGALGAEINDVDLGNLSDGELAEIRQAYSDYGVLFFRNQNLSPEQHIAFAELWGKININRFFQAVDDYPMIALVNKEPEQTMNIGSIWHTDHSYDEIPALGSVLVARELPPYGGDTLFCSPSAAYEALSEGMKKTLEGMNALHTSRGFGRKDVVDSMDGRFGSPEKSNQDVIHPVVITHPLSGKKVLYVNPGFTRHFEGWTEEESKPLLEYLYKHIAKPDYTCRLNWKPGSVAFWDNRAVWHYALNDYQGHKRLMHRITIEGTPVGR